MSFFSSNATKIHIKSNDTNFNNSLILSTGTITTGTLSNADDNIGIGYQSLNSLTSGNDNVGIGTDALKSLTSGYDNVCIGFNAGKSISSSYENVLIGENAGSNLVGGNKNTCIGAGAHPGDSYAGNRICIGYNVTGAGNNRAIIGNVDVSQVYMNSNGDAVIYANGNITSSDSRIKDNIVDIVDSVALQQVRDIPCRNYTYKDTNRRGTDSTPGFIAQEVESVYPLAVSTHTNCIPNEYRLLTNYTLVETTTLIDSNNTEPEYYWKLTVNDLTDLSTTNKYRFTFSDDTTFDYNNGNNDTVSLTCIDGESTSFLVNKQWTHIFLYGKQVTDFKKIDKTKIFTLHHSAIHQLDTTLTAEQVKIVTLESKVATLETELAAIKTHLGL